MRMRMARPCAYAQSATPRFTMYRKPHGHNSYGGKTCKGESWLGATSRHGTSQMKWWTGGVASRTVSRGGGHDKGDTAKLAVCTARRGTARRGTARHSKWRAAGPRI